MVAEPSTAQKSSIERNADTIAALGNHGRWYAVQCQPHRESGAAANLANQDFETFLPFCNKTRRHARKVDTIRVPLFPGYLFVRLDLMRDRWRSVNSTFGVTRLVMQGERPAPAPDGVIETLKDACGEDGLVSWRTNLAVGRTVRILFGPFADFVGELDQLTDADRVRVLLDIMGGRTPVSVSRGYVVPVDSSV